MKTSWRLPLTFAFVLLLACDSEGMSPVDVGTCQESVDGGSSASDDAKPAVCPPGTNQGLRAAFWEIRDRRSALVGLEAGLKRAGWRTTKLPLNQPPDGLGVDLIVLGSFVSEDPGYSAYLAAHASAMQRFVEAGGTLLQFTQAADVAPQGAFLPPNLSFSRTAADLAEIFATIPSHPLLRGLVVPQRDDHLVYLPSVTPPSGIATRPACWNCPHDQTGFRVIAAARRDGEFPALAESSGSNGFGRILMSGLHLDKVFNSKGDVAVLPPVASASQMFFRNLADYVGLLKRGLLEPPAATPTYPARAPLAFQPGSSFIMAFPDTQNHVYPRNDFDGMAIFRSQTSWVSSSSLSLPTSLVVNVGDIVERNSDAEWASAVEAFSLLPPTQPLLLSTGNHDHGLNGGGVPRATKFAQYFPLDRFRAMSSFGGALDSAENSYHFIDITGEPWIVLGLEWAPRDSTLEWAKGILANHPDRRAIVATHAYMFSDETRYDYAKAISQPWNPHSYFGDTPEGNAVNDGEEIWQKLIKVSPNVRLVLSGHVAQEGLGRMISKNDAGIDVHQLAFNYQSYALGGAGYLRILEFLADKKTLRAHTYSPFTNQYLTDDQNQFELTISP